MNESWSGHKLRDRTPYFNRSLDVTAIYIFFPGRRIDGSWMLKSKDMNHQVLYTLLIRSHYYTLAIEFRKLVNKHWRKSIFGSIARMLYSGLEVRNICVRTIYICAMLSSCMTAKYIFFCRRIDGSCMLNSKIWTLKFSIHHWKEVSHYSFNQIILIGMRLGGFPDLTSHNFWNGFCQLIFYQKFSNIIGGENCDQSG